MNILVTGGLGFIGTNLVNILLKQGHLVYIVDDLSTGRLTNLTWLYRENKEATQDRKIHFIRCDITDKKNFHACVKSAGAWKLDQIYHLACPASPPKYWKDPIKTLDINYIGTKNVLDLAVDSRAEVLFSSTSEVYGDPEVHPQPEAYRGSVDPLNPRSVYDEGKRVAETLVAEYHRQYGLKTKIARISNTYGPRMDPDDGRVVTNFIRQGLLNKPIEIYGDGGQTRSLCYIDDTASALIKIMNTDKFINEAVNIGTTEEITIHDLALRIKALLSSSSDIIYKPEPPGDPKRRQLETSRLRSLGWQPKAPMWAGLTVTIDYMIGELDLPTHPFMNET